MLWLIVTISTYLILAIVFLVDKYLLVGSIPNPKIYTFYVGILGVLALILIPFVDFIIPQFSQIVFSLIVGALYILGLFWFYKALQLFEPSRIVPAISAFIPIFTSFLIYVFSGGKETINFFEFLLLALLISGSVLITYEKDKKISLKSLQISIITAFFLALHFVLIKYVYLQQPFWSGFIWTKMGGALMGLSFLFLGGVREKLFKAKINIRKRTAGLFLANQTLGAGASVLQNFAIALAPIIYIPIINALQGVQYVFLLIFAIFISWKFPRILKEEISKKIIFQKILAILLIGIGLVLLTK